MDDLEIHGLSVGEGNLYFDNVTISESLLFVWRGGATLRLTRRERAVLGLLLAHPGRLLDRGALLGAMVGRQVEICDRNVDLVINALRAKLGDRARAPRFIATQYGEGYVWIASRGRGRGPEQSCAAMACGADPI